MYLFTNHQRLGCSGNSTTRAYEVPRLRCLDGIQRRGMVAFKYRRFVSKRPPLPGAQPDSRVSRSVFSRLIGGPAYLL